MEKSVRINKYLADHQYASRREADTLITSGKVFINGRKAVLGDKVGEGDKVKVKGVKQEALAYYAYHKPRGIVTVNGQFGDKAIKDISTFPEKVYPLGRLDKESEGLILLTNDGRLTNALLNPKSGHEKEYKVTVNKKITHTFIQKMQSGVPIGEVGAIKNYVTKSALVRKGDPQVFDIVLTEGKNRQIRRMCNALGYDVTQLRRFRVMNILLNNLPVGEYRKIEGKELTMFLKKLGLDILR